MENAVLHLENADIYQRDNLVLSKVNLTIAKGGFYYLIGKTGSGKSSLMKTLYGDLKLQSGMGTIVDLKAPVFIMADRMLVEVALRNILDNAVKYSPPDQTGRIMLDQQKTMAQICVIDQGRGIKGVNIKGQHKRFKRGSNVDDVVGSGLGLAIINEICATFGGKFNLKNNRSGGACAIIQLPLC